MIYDLLLEREKKGFMNERREEEGIVWKSAETLWPLKALTQISEFATFSLFRPTEWRPLAFIKGNYQH